MVPPFVMYQVEQSRDRGKKKYRDAGLPGTSLGQWFLSHLDSRKIFVCLTVLNSDLLRIRFLIAQNDTRLNDPFEMEETFGVAPKLGFGRNFLF